ncbi:T1SS-143 repeat domain-containing protein [Mesorhizobium atlanticum]
MTFSIVTETQTNTTTDTKEVGSHIIFEDSVPSASDKTVTGEVDEDALSSNALPDKDGSATASGSVTTLFNPGADTPLSYKLSSDFSSLTSQGLVSGGTALTYEVSADGTTLTATKGVGGATVFTLTLDTSGNWSFTLSAPVDHAPGANDASNTVIDFSGLVLAADADNPNFAAGDIATAATGALTVKVIDDVPVNFNPRRSSAATTCRMPPAPTSSAASSTLMQATGPSIQIRRSPSRNMPAPTASAL